MEPLEKFSQTLKVLAGIPDDQLNRLLACSQVKSIKKGAYFIREGQHPAHMAFVVKGLFRYFYLDSKGCELTKGFMPEGSFINAYSALIQNSTSHFSIEALEPSTVVVFLYKDWRSLLDAHPCWSKVLIHLLEKGYCVKERREREFLLLDAQARYRSFLQTYPNLDQRVKQHMVASYLGITPVALSRIRRKFIS